MDLESSHSEIAFTCYWFSLQLETATMRQEFPTVQDSF